MADEKALKGKKAPDFTLLDQDGNKLKLSSLRGKTVVLYFYPKDMTSGCTTQACEFRDASKQYAKADAVVIGISPDDPASHTKFRAKHDLPFTLLADTEHKVCEKYGVWKQKSMYGRKYMGVERSTFVIAPDGKVVEELRKVKAAGNAAEVLALIDG